MLLCISSVICTYSNSVQLLSLTKCIINVKLTFYLICVSLYPCDLLVTSLYIRVDLAPGCRWWNRQHVISTIKCLKNVNEL